MGIMDMFKTATAPAAPAQSNPGGLPANSGVADPANPTVPPGTVANSQANQTQTASPLAEFDKFWETPPVDPNAQTSIFGDVDPKAIHAAAGKANFVNSIPKETFEKIAQGGQEAMLAFAQVMNQVGQQVYAQSAIAATKIAEQAANKSREGVFAELPTHLKSYQLGDSLLAKNPALSNPAVKPLVDAMKAQMAVKYPNATTAELTQMAENYVAGVGEIFNPTKVETSSNTAKPGEDWENFLTGMST